MSYAEYVTALKGSDAFHKNVILLLADLATLVSEKTHTGKLTHLDGPENNYSVWSEDGSEYSEYRGAWVFDFDNRIRFAEVLVGTYDRALKGESHAYKAMCSQLARDPKVPLLLIYGVFEPRDTARFYNDRDARRQWVRNATLIDLHEEQSYSAISALQFDKPVTVESKEGTDSYWCEKAKFVICDLTTITDNTKLSSLADQLLKL
jgi:hypothetical protein